MNTLLKLLSKLRNESGNVLVIVAIGMTVLLGFAALVMDSGRLYSEKSKLQKALDAAVLGGGQVMLNDHSQDYENTKLFAEDISNDNNITLYHDDITVTTNSTPNYIKITKEITVPMTFAKVLGINDAKVSATAKAIVGPLKAGKGITPIAVEESAISNGRLNCMKKKHSPGNCGYLSIVGTGANNWAEAIKYGSDISIGSFIDGEQEDDEVATQPGSIWGKVKDAINGPDGLIKSDEEKEQCQSASTVDNSCNRLLFVPIVKSWNGVTGRDSIEIIGLAAYWLKGINGKVIEGEFIRMVGPGEIDDTRIGEKVGYNLQGVKLVE